MLNLFQCVPAPQVSSFLIGILPMPWIGEKLLGQDRGKMLEDHRRRQIGDLGPVLGHR